MVLLSARTVFMRTTGPLSKTHYPRQTFVQQVRSYAEHGHGHGVNEPFPFAINKTTKRALATKCSMFMGAGFSIPFFAVWWKSVRT